MCDHISESASTRGRLSALTEAAAAKTGAAVGAGKPLLTSRPVPPRGASTPDASPREQLVGGTPVVGRALIRVSSGTIRRHPCHPLALDDGNESELTRVVPSGAGVHGEVTARATTNNVVKSVAAK